MSFRDWRYVKLGDIAKVTKLAGFEFTKHINYIDTGEIIAIRALNVKNGTFDLTDIKRIERNVSESLTRSKLYKNEIVLTYTGAKFGEVAMVKYDDKFHLAPNVAKVTANEGCDPYFLYSCFRGSDFRQQLINYSGGSSQPTIPMSAIRQLTVPLPSLKEQRAIAETLSCLDDKIELNKRINENLEQQAQVLFKSWFVDFKNSTVDKLVSCEIGIKPATWSLASLTDIADYINGLAMQKYRPIVDEVGIPVLKIKELRQGICDNTSDLCSPSIKNEYIVKDGDVVFSWSGSLLVDYWCGGRCGLNQHLFKVTSSKYAKWFYYLWTNFHLQKFIAIAADKATTMGHIKREDLTKSKVLIPDNESYQKFDAIFTPLFENIIANRIENRKLSEIRDALLPKLLSGEIHFSEE